jgi:hypothetical protein
MTRSEQVAANETQAKQNGSKRVAAALGICLTGSLLVAGCSDGGDAPRFPGIVNTTSADATPSASASPSVTPSPSLTNTVYPKGARGCVENATWTKAEKIEWLSGIVQYGSATENYKLNAADEVYVNSGPLCEALSVQAIFWRTESDNPIQLYPGEIKDVTVDGGHAMTIINNAPTDAPLGSPSTGSYSCEGNARAMYLGPEPITNSDIPSQAHILASVGSLSTSDFTTRSDRAVDGTLSCYGADPNDSGYRWGLPTPYYSYGLPTYTLPSPTFNWMQPAKP